MMANDLPLWHTVYRQMQHWLKAGVFEDMVCDLRMLMREVEGRTLQSSPESGGRAGYDVVLGVHFVPLPRRWVVERSSAWMTRFRRLARDYARLSETLVGLHFVAFAILLAHRLEGYWQSSRWSPICTPVRAISPARISITNCARRTGRSMRLQARFRVMATTRQSLLT